jgi:hypothetical protein
MTLIIIALLVSLGYILSCIKAGRLARRKTTRKLYIWNGRTYDEVPRPTRNRRGGRLARLLVASKQIT